MALTLHSCGAHAVAETDLSKTEVTQDVAWIDLLQPTPDEAAFVERATGLHVPTLAELSEIESSSRLYTEDGALYLSTPVVFRADSGQPVTTPLGFVLTRDRLITIRFEPLPVFENFKIRVAKPDGVHPTGVGVFAGLLEALVDRIADVLERVGADLDAVSQRVFRDPAERSGRSSSASADMDLRETLRAIGRSGDLLSRIRDSLLGIGRIGPYVSGRTADWLPAEVRHELETLRLDVLSINDYDAHLQSKIEFLLDATLGFVNLEQNNIIKVLTVVSVLVIGPTLVGTWYGMNFKGIPELDWSFGYLYAGVLAVVSVIGPLIWFRRRGWF